MSLKTKSVQKPVEMSDGIRVCVMRRPDKDVVWDIWMPHLAPSHELLTQYHHKEIEWPEFCVRFEKDVIKGEREYLDILIEMSKKHLVTILCWEETPEMCHRRLIAEACSRIDSKLDVQIE